mmetsp:Transcript_763/g.1603  ORF Transcript_763/g.1603 Transcript_763/m.1603 type:complete len:266 (+) Transcript_763:162-959(+)
MECANVCSLNDGLKNDYAREASSLASGMNAANNAFLSSRPAKKTIKVKLLKEKLRIKFKMRRRVITSDDISTGKKKRRREEQTGIGDEISRPKKARQDAVVASDSDCKESDRHDQRWESHFQSLLDYKKNHNGSTAVPQTYKEKPELGIWVHRQRTRFFSGRLSKDRIQRLNSVGFVWQVTKYVPWETMYQRLVEYKERFGTTQVPRSYKEDPALGYWVYNQRQKCKKEERKRLLKKIGFVWCVKKRSPQSKNCASLESLRKGLK